MGSAKRGSRGKGQRMDLNLTSLTCRWLAASVIARFNLTVTECCGDCIGDNSCRRSCHPCYFRGNLCLMSIMAPLSPVLFFFFRKAGNTGEWCWADIPILATESRSLRLPHPSIHQSIFYHCLSCTQGHRSWNLSRLPQGEEGIHSGQVPSSSKGLYVETNKQSRWLSRQFT